MYQPTRQAALWAAPTLALLLLAACSGSPGTELDGGSADAEPPPPRDAGPPPPPRDAGFPDSGAGPVACDPALSATPSSAAVLPLDLFTVRVNGGTGAYRFELETNASGAIINELSGAYLSGATEGATDTVRVTDEGCLGEVRVQIRVVPTLRLVPANVTAQPDTAWQFETSGGSGTFRFSAILAGSGGSITEAGLYIAGSAEGRDRVEVLDLETGQTAEATIDVTAGARMTASPPMVFLPEGHEFELGFTGGSGFVEVLESVSAFELREGHVVHGLAEGREVVTLRDRFTGQTSPLVVGVHPGQEFTAELMGDGLFSSRMLAPGDINGDGFPDAILAHPDADVRANNDGAIFVYAGNATGLDPTPAQVLSGSDRRDELGRAVAVGDFNRDGRIDLAVGAPRTDSAGVDAGIVRIHLGIAGGFFDPQPDQVLAGPIAGDLFGWAVTTCDFNDDGFLDLAVGAFSAEDRSRTPIRFGQGGVFVFLAHDAGFRDTPSRVLWGDEPDGAGGWTGRSNMRHGIALAAGDMDGDGVCDLAAGTYEYDRAGSANDGLVYVYRGVASDGTSPGGLEERPVRGWASLDPTDRGGQLGRNLAVGDLDGDGRAELAISHHLNDIGPSDSHGAIRVFRGTPFGMPITEIAPVAPADWEIIHNGGGDQLGFMPVIDDATGDGRNDLIIGNIADEIAGGPTNAGTVHVFAGVPSAMPDITPTRTLSGDNASDYLGAAVAVIGDRDGDRIPEMVALAHYADRYGREYGVPFMFYGADVPAVPLEMAGEPSGMRFGWDGAIVGDVTGNGFEDLVVTAPLSTISTIGRLSGAAYLYEGGMSGFAKAPTTPLTGMTRHSAFDQLGYGVSSAGDFDNDGRPDFALTVRLEDRAASYGNAYAPEANCPTTSSNDVGAVFVFRGGASGLASADPAFIYYGPIAGDGLRTVAGGFDYDNDGYDDLIVGNLDFDRPPTFNMGGFVLVRGRPADAQGRITVICAADFQFLGRVANDQLGYSVAAIGDVNGDGCDEVAAGAPFEDPLGSSNEGSVRVIFGWGGAGCPANPEMVVMRGAIRNAQAGRALRGGGDIDRDGVPDLAVGLPAFAQNGNTVGAAAVIYGAHIASLPREPAQDVSDPVNWSLMFDGTRPPAVAVGRTPGEEFGRGVALIDLGPQLGTALVSGSPSGDLSGVTRAGGAQVFIWTAGAGMVQLPVAGFGGETLRVGGRSGELVRGGSLGGRPILLVGGYDGTSSTLDGGSVYVFDLTIPTLP